MVQASLQYFTRCPDWCAASTACTKRALPGAGVKFANVEVCSLATVGIEDLPGEMQAQHAALRVEVDLGDPASVGAVAPFGPGEARDQGA